MIYKFICEEDRIVTVQIPVQVEASNKEEALSLLKEVYTKSKFSKKIKFGYLEIIESTLSDSPIPSTGVYPTASIYDPEISEADPVFTNLK
jgi:hypothetical protein